MKMTHAQWMSDTASFARPRSAELKAIDSALLAYETASRDSKGSVLNELRALKAALEAWKKAQTQKGQRWQDSVRNKLKAVEKLDAELGLVIVGSGGLNSRGEVMMDPEEVRAAKLLAASIKDNLRSMFAGQRLTVKNSKALADLGTVVGAMNTFKTTSKQIAVARSAIPQPNLAQQVQSTLVSLFGDVPASQVQEALGGVFTDFLTNVTPFVGAIKSGAQALVKWGQAAKGLYARHQMAAAESSFAPGDPAAAFSAILLIQQREVKAYATEGSILTISAAAKVSFAAADFGVLSGTLVGAAESLALLVQKIYLFARDWREMKAANTQLAAGALDLSLFKVCPLLGCYLIANSNTSHVINLAVGDYGKVGWKFEVELMVRQAQPVFEKAREVILDSRFEFAGMRGMKGTVVDRTEKTLGIPVGKIAGLVGTVEGRINRVGS